MKDAFKSIETEASIAKYLNVHMKRSIISKLMLQKS